MAIKNANAEFVFELVMKMAGGADKYSIHTQGAIYAECVRNTTLQTLAGMYLVGSSARAESNLKNLRSAVYSTFLERN